MTGPMQGRRPKRTYTGPLAASALQIDHAAADPMYQQIVAQVSRLVASGALADGTPLPSVREVASVHQIHPMTVSKAYSVLTAQGLVLQRRGHRGVVRAAAAMDTSARLVLLDVHLRRAAKVAMELGISGADVLRRMNSVLGADARDEQTSLATGTADTWRGKRKEKRVLKDQN